MAAIVWSSMAPNSARWLRAHEFFAPAADDDGLAELLCATADARSRQLAGAAVALTRFAARFAPWRARSRVVGFLYVASPRLVGLVARLVTADSAVA